MRFGKEWPNIRTYRAAYINSQVVGLLVVANGDGRVGKIVNSYPEVSIYVQTLMHLQMKDPVNSLCTQVRYGLD
jgi:hypothetical protein